MKLTRYLLIGALLMTTSLTTQAVEPIGDAAFNVESGGIDFAALTPANFYDVIVPMAEQEGTVIFFDFSNSFEPLFREHLIPAFEAKYKVKVDYQRGDRDAAAQQLIATNNAGQPAPFDVMFTSSGNVFPLVQVKVMANVPMSALLPNATRLDPQIANVTDGFDHGGRYLPFHRNQTALVYVEGQFADGNVPDDAASLLEWAKANPGHFAVTSPARGGSGDGFMQSLMMELITDPACTGPLGDYGIDEAAATAFVGSDCVKPVWDYYRDLISVAEVTAGNSDTLNLVTNGVAWIGTAWEDMTFDFVNRGLLPPTTRLTLMEHGQVGGGDGYFMPPRTAHPAAAMLLMDFLVSAEMQTVKLALNGSRTANLDVVTEGQIPAEKVPYLVADDIYAARKATNLPRAIVEAGKVYFQDNILRK
jgi:putative spermidine/putrescine transport system substrate-binding protein